MPLGRGPWTVARGVSCFGARITVHGSRKLLKAATHAASTSDITTILFAIPCRARWSHLRFVFFQTPREPTAKPLSSPLKRLRCFPRKSGRWATGGEGFLRDQT